MSKRCAWCGKKHKFVNCKYTKIFMKNMGMGKEKPYSKSSKKLEVSK